MSTASLRHSARGQRAKLCQPLIARGETGEICDEIFGVFRAPFVVMFGLMRVTGVAVLLLASGALWACGGSAETASAAGASGGADATTPVSAGNAGVPTNQPNGCLPTDDLAGWCAADPNTDPNAGPRCPTSIDTITYACNYPDASMRYPSSCGGVSISVVRGDTETVWHFDAAGMLIGAAIPPSARGGCAAGARVYGQSCDKIGPPVDLCAIHDAPCVSAPLGCPSSKAYFCPASADDLSALLCTQSPSYTQLTRAQSSCGGPIIISESSGLHGETWSFDASNQLVGTTYRSDTPQRCPDGTQSFTKVWGDVCTSLGQPTPLCSE